MAIKIVTKHVVPEPYEETTYVCDVCQAEFFWEVEAQSHALVHENIKVFDACGVTAHLFDKEDQGMYERYVENLMHRGQIDWDGPGYYVHTYDIHDNDVFIRLDYEVERMKRNIASNKKLMEKEQSKVEQLEALLKGETK